MPRGRVGDTIRLGLTVPLPSNFITWASGMPEVLAYITLFLTAAVLALLLPFALHRTYLLWLSRRERSAVRDPWPESELPHVTIQLPVYNELHVVRRADPGRLYGRHDRHCGETRDGVAIQGRVG